MTIIFSTKLNHVFCKLIPINSPQIDIVIISASDNFSFSLLRLFYTFSGAYFLYNSSTIT